MNNLTIFYLKDCPFCNKAFILIHELISENPAYATIEIVKIEESEQKALADSFDYYYVPCIYYKSKKLSEGSITKNELKQIFDQLL